MSQHGSEGDLCGTVWRSGGARHAQILPLKGSTVMGQRERRQARVGAELKRDFVWFFFFFSFLMGNSSMFPDCGEARTR